MPQSYDFIFKPARVFWEKLLKKLGTHILLGKNLRHLRYLRDLFFVPQISQIYTDTTTRVYMPR